MTTSRFGADMRASPFRSPGTGAVILSARGPLFPPAKIARAAPGWDNPLMRQVPIPPAFPPAHAEQLRTLSCRGTFEAHLTVQADGPERREAFRLHCAGLG